MYKSFDLYYFPRIKQKYSQIHIKSASIHSLHNECKNQFKFHVQFSNFIHQKYSKLMIHKKLNILAKYYVCG